MADEFEESGDVPAVQEDEAGELQTTDGGDFGPETLPVAQRPYDTLTEAERDAEFDRVYAAADPEMSQRALRESWPAAARAAQVILEVGIGKPIQQYEDVTDKRDSPDVAAAIRDLFGDVAVEGERCEIAPLPAKPAHVPAEAPGNGDGEGVH